MPGGAVPSARMTRAARASARFPGVVASVADRVEARVDALLEQERTRWEQVDPALAGPIEALQSFVTGGGKRLRPAFCHCAFVGAGGDPDDPLVIDAAAALELVHTFALIHDDVMDGSDMRRGSDAVHRHFVREHVNARWRGPRSPMQSIRWRLRGTASWSTTRSTRATWCGRCAGC